jgi:diketogulonate reductase-like aldo/keto reductase
MSALSSPVVFGSSVSSIGVGFGTAGLGGNTIAAVTAALQEGFRNFDTAEASWWYDQAAVGYALKQFFSATSGETCVDHQEDALRLDQCSTTIDCGKHSIRVSTKIPPWELLSSTHIRQRAADSRKELLGFCDPISLSDQGIIANPFTEMSSYGDVQDESSQVMIPYPLDVYYIHAPKCWDGWHPNCDGVTPDDTLDLREAWLAMEAVVGLDHSAARIGLSNVNAEELEDIIEFVHERLQSGQQEQYPPPRMPDAVQIYADPLDSAVELRQLCSHHGIEFVSYSTLGTQHMRYENSKNPVLQSKVIQRIAAHHGRSTAEVVLSWAIQNGMSVIPRSGNADHINELAKLIHSPPFLTIEEVASIDAMNRR